VWGEKCAAVLFSRAARSMQVLGAGSVVPESRMKRRGLWGKICARVFRPRATEQWACARRESVESVVPAQPVVTRTPHITGRPN
jgi:hypothetical protein